jgi:hypothetical protein
MIFRMAARHMSYALCTSPLPPGPDRQREQAHCSPLPAHYEQDPAPARTSTAPAFRGGGCVEHERGFKQESKEEGAECQRVHLTVVVSTRVCTRAAISCEGRVWTVWPLWCRTVRASEGIGGSASAIEA